MANVVATFTANIAPFQSAMGSLATSVKAGTDAASNAGQRVGGAMASIGKASTIAGVAVGAMAVSSIKSYGDFENSLNKAAVVGGSSSKDLTKNISSLEDEALNLGTKLPISAQDAGDAMLEMARNGASVSDLKKEFPAIAEAASVTGDDLSETAITVQNAMNIWGGGAANAAKDSAILAKNANLSKVGIGDMGQAFANVGATAESLGIDVATTSAAIGVMANSGLGAAQGSQDLAHALTLMARPSKVAAGEMQELGITYTDAQGKFKPFPQILKEVAKATDGLSQSQKIAALTNLFGAAGEKAMLPLLKSTQKEASNGKSVWDNYAGSLNGVGNNAKSASKYLSTNAQNMTKNVGQALDQMKDDWTALTFTALKTDSKPIQQFAKAVGNVANSLQKSHGPLATFVKSMIAMAPAIAVGLVAFGLLSSGVGKLVTALSAPAKAIKAIAGSTSKLPKPMSASASQIAAMGAKSLGAGVGIGVAVAGFAALAFGVAALAQTGNTGIAALAAMTVAVIAITGAFALMGPALTKNAVGLAAFGIAAGGLGVGIGAATLGIAAMIIAFTGLTQNVNNIIPTFSAVGTGAILMMTTILSGIVSNAPLITQALIALGTSILTAINTLSPQIMQTVATLLLNLLTTLATYAPQYAAKALEILVSVLNTIAQYVGPIAGGVTNILIAILQAIGANAPAIIAAFFAMIGQLASAIVQQMPYIIQIFGALMAGLIAAGITYSTSFLKLGGVLMQALWAGITGKKFDIGAATADVMKGAAASASQAGSSAFDAMGGNSAITALNGIAKKRSQANKAGSDLMSSAKSGMESKKGEANSAGSSVANSAVSGIGSKKGAAQSEGSYFGAGFNNGLASQRGNINATAASLADSASATIQSHLKIHSPSRVTYSFGSYFGQGFANGISSLTGEVKKAAVSVATSATTGLSSGLSSVRGAMANMASQMSTGISANVSGLSMAGTQFSSGDVTQSIDASERITPNIYVQNNVDKNGINSMVKEADANDAAVSSYFRPIGG
ncbi:phage tail tape measure protein [Lacticaseibacillus paracasei]|uniref:phage tail tape measure protein n=1 Tax=Lacticaseibacillus paracasei TaxID=1597 RepID=UPI001891C859|nr:phage tail tape measure protein [Lacticaseibacillus paracasei]QPB56704.1 phage tail tape measure protein [Lacticaseibacillus paracasei]WPQ31774.1 phage tail tape measure protein [Lacticaseibacillus paracasei]